MTYQKKTLIAATVSKESKVGDSKEIDGNRLAGWLSVGGLAKYQDWLSKDPTEALEQLSKTTFNAIFKNWSAWSGHFKPAESKAFFAKAIQLFNERLTLVSDTERCREAIRFFLQSLWKIHKLLAGTIKEKSATQIYAIDILLQNSSELFAKNRDSASLSQFDPTLFFDLFQILNRFQTMSIEALANIVEAMGSFTRSEVIREDYQKDNGQTKTFEQEWDNWLRKIEEELDKVDKSTLSCEVSCKFLAGFADLAERNYLMRPFQIETINSQLCGLLQEPTDLLLQYYGLIYIKNLIDNLAIAEVTSLDLQVLSEFLNRPKQESKVKKQGYSTPITGADILKKVSQIYQKISEALPYYAPKPISLEALNLSLEVDINLPLKSKERAQRLLSSGKILQVSRQAGIESKLKATAAKHIAALNVKKTADAMSLTDIADALYSLVLPKEQSWLDIGPTDNLVAAFQRKVEYQLSQKKPPSEKLGIAIQKGVEYLYPTEQKVSADIVAYLQAHGPEVDEQSLQHRFLVYLKEQSWFKQNYEIVTQKIRIGDQEKEIEEELLYGFARRDFVIRHKKTGEVYNVEVDGQHHQFRGPQQERGDKYLLSFKNSGESQPFFKGVIRLLVSPGTKIEDMEFQLYNKLAKHKVSIINNFPELEKAESDSKKTTKLNYPISLEGLKKAIRDRDIESIIKLVYQLINRSALEQDHGKANILKYAIAQHKDIEDPISETIIAKLASILGQRIMTTDHEKESPLSFAIKRSNKIVVAIFIRQIIPEKFRNRSLITYPFWQQALVLVSTNGKYKNKNIADLLTAAGVVLPKKITAANLLRSIHLGVDEKKIAHKRPEVAEVKDKPTKVRTVKFNKQDRMMRCQQDNPQWTEQLENLVHSGDAKAQYRWSQLFYDFDRNKIKDAEQFLYWTRLSAKNGYGPAQNDLGVCYREGEGLKKDDKEAAKWFKLAAKQGSSEAQCSLGVLYKTGIGVEKDDKEAIRLYKLAAVKGHANAQYNLSVCYLGGDGVEQDFKEGVKWLTLAAKQGFAMAQCSLGHCYFNGYGVEKDIEEAKKWLKLAEEQGFKGASEIFREYHEKQDDKAVRNARPKFNRVACYLDDQGLEQDDSKIELIAKQLCQALDALKDIQSKPEEPNKETLLNLAVRHYQEGNFKKAVEYCEAVKDYGPAQYFLGVCYHYGKGVVQDWKKATELYVLAANQGVKYAQHNLGFCYEKGQGVAQDYKEAVRLYALAAEQGLESAQDSLGVCYENGQGVAQDYKEAARLYALAAEQGSSYAQNNLGLCYENGQGVAQDYKEAARLYALAAEQGFKNAQNNLGLCYETGQGVAQDYKEAARLFALAAEQGFKNAQHNLGFCYEKGQGVAQDYKEAARLYALAAEQGSKNAQNNLGLCYEKGQGVAQDYKEAVRLFALAAEQGSGFAQYNLAVRYEKGQGVAQDYKEAARLYALAAEQGFKNAQDSLGVYYEKGRGVAQDYKEAARLYALAAEQGSRYAQYNLGLCYENGQGVAQDYKEAARLYTLATEQGFEYAQCNLGLCYQKGQGVEQDDKQAIKWFELSAAGGYARAQTILGICYLKGQSVEQDDKQAVKWFTSAVQQGEATAQYYLAQCYFIGEGIEADLEEAKKLYTLASEQGIKKASDALQKCQPADVYYLKAIRYQEKNSLQESVRFFELAAELGHTEGEYNLGLCYMQGNGVERNIQTAIEWLNKAASKAHLKAQHYLGLCRMNEAVYWFEMAAEQGDTDAQCDLGECYALGKGVQKNYKIAIEWYRKAAALNNARAQFNLGICYMRGHGVEQDYKEAITWLALAEKQGYEEASDALKKCQERHNIEKEAKYRLGVSCYQDQNFEEAARCFEFAAQGGHSAAQYALGECFRKGAGVTQDSKKAVRWFESAVQQGHTEAQCALGECYREGQGIKQDSKEALRLFQLAAQQGCAEASSLLETIIQSRTRPAHLTIFGLFHPASWPLQPPSPVSTVASAIVDSPTSLPFPEEKKLRTLETPGSDNKVIDQVTKPLKMGN